MEFVDSRHASGIVIVSEAALRSVASRRAVERSLHSAAKTMPPLAQIALLPLPRTRNCSRTYTRNGSRT